ncbi:hypothetical protein [Geoalkalibacter halelectricus]|uniref:Leucine rich repeat variant n=1 Tax=Geoalkalibacter halelectricus TaxID=2847045 RepID=A0ABY5ZTF2_9BACT|nr:hypothetical protein [Geoalkalibacter halelectricus]MDO3377010.1 hypothetical protein [Geoalkalibacter halelectricus]UWZ81232.1 hypothetical protein L9S41_07540 [Geoalkalibacter halelectricus]
MVAAAESGRLRVSARVAEIVGKSASPDLRWAAARGELALGTDELLLVLVFLSRGGDEDLRRQALATLRALPVEDLLASVANPRLPAQALHLVARVHLQNPRIMAAVVANPATANATLIGIARHAESDLLDQIAADRQRLADCPELVAALSGNPHTPARLRRMLATFPGVQPPAAGNSAEHRTETETPSETAPQDVEDDGDGETCAEQDEEVNASKYQLSLELPVAEKIKTALTGDKEWRTILLRDANKLVSSAVLKNPRITDGEVLAVARNRSANDELIRLVLLNNEWVKSPEIRKALVVHPRTPLPKAMRFMSGLSEKELKQLAKSRNVSQAIVNNARRMLAARDKKK